MEPRAASGMKGNTTTTQYSTKSTNSVLQYKKSHTLLKLQATHAITQDLCKIVSE